MRFFMPSSFMPSSLIAITLACLSLGVFSHTAAQVAAAKTKTEAETSEKTPAAAAAAAKQQAEDAEARGKAMKESAKTGDEIRDMQTLAMQQQSAAWGHWGIETGKYSSWTNHSNRLIPMYTFGMDLKRLRRQGSIFTDAKRIEKLYGSVPEGTLNPKAEYFDQTDVYRLQNQALRAGKKNIILMVFDGMDWQTTRAAALYKTGKVGYDSGRGTGLAFQDFDAAKTDFGAIVTSAAGTGATYDVNSQVLSEPNQETPGGYDAKLGGDAPWSNPVGRSYLIGKDRTRPNIVTDSAASATSMTAAAKTFNGSINIALDGSRLETIGQRLQRDKGFKIGVVTSVPVSHATPAAAYAHNVTRKDYQDISRDLLGLPSSSHRSDPLPGVDVLIGAGWGEGKGEDKLQGENFRQGNLYMHEDDVRRSDLANGGRYRVVKRQAGINGADALLAAAADAATDGTRLLGFFGVKNGHLPFQTADGNFNPTIDVKGTERYSEADIAENPTLADMTNAALTVLEKSESGFWLMIEAGDVDWANHANNVDSSIGAVLSGEAAFVAATNWISARNAWDDTAIILTADHGHYLVIDDPAAIAAAGQ